MRRTDERLRGDAARSALGKRPRGCYRIRQPVSRGTGAHPLPSACLAAALEALHGHVVVRMQRGHPVRALLSRRTATLAGG